MSEKYNGYENYETWLVSLWLNNEYNLYQHWHKRAEEICESTAVDPRVMRGSWAETQAVKYTLAREIKAHLKENAPNTTGLWADLQNAALSCVNWHEVADSFLEE